jgi:tight adherence protein B
MDFVLFVTCVRVARDLGGNLAEAVERLAASLRRKLVMEDRIDALTAQGRLQGWIVGLLPVFLAGVLAWLEPDAMRRLYTTPIGWSVLAVLAVLLGAGALLIRKIVRIDI